MFKRIISGIVLVMTILSLCSCSVNINKGGYSLGMNRVEEASDKTVSGGNIKSLNVTSAVGSVKVSTWDKNDIYVKVKKVNNGLKDKQILLEELKNAEIMYNEDNGTLSIKTFLPKFKNNGISIELDISVPKSITVFKIESEVGDVGLTGIEGQMDVVNNVGKTDLSQCSGKINLKAITGDITVRDCTLKSDSNITGNTGRVLFDGSIDKQGTYKLTTNVGKLDVTLPSSLAFDINATVDVGAIDCGFKVAGTLEDRKVQGKVNGGGPVLILLTNVGSISVTKGD